jgi:hypothetical protein
MVNIEVPCDLQERNKSFYDCIFIQDILLHQAFACNFIELEVRSNQLLLERLKQMQVQSLARSLPELFWLTADHLKSLNHYHRLSDAQIRHEMESSNGQSKT